MTCFDCLYRKVCEDWAEEVSEEYGCDCAIYKCKNYKNKADVVDSPKWISVEERLPEENVRVLVWLKENDSYTRIDTDRLAHSSVTFWVRWGKYVTHWCPIPERLKEGAE